MDNLPEIMTALAELVAELPEDERLRLDTIEGETQLFELMDAYAERAIANRELAKRAHKRAQRLDAAADRDRAIVEHIIEAIGVHKLRRPLYTATISQHDQVEITGDVPEEYQRYAPDLRAIERMLRDGSTVNWARLTQHQRLTLRTK